MANGWKITAIIFIILFVAETAFIGWGAYLVQHEEENRAECYYEICKDYNNADYNIYRKDNVCYCYTDDFEIAKSEYLK